MRAPLLLAGLIAAVLAAHVPAEEPDIYAAARAAVAAGEVEKTDLVGPQYYRKEFRDVPAEGAVLIGFDVAINKFFDDETIVALRPVFRSARGDRAGPDHGRFPGPADANRRDRDRIVSLRARAGYAVGAITLRTRPDIKGMSLTYMKVSGSSLDRKQKYSSSWYGSRDGDEVVLGGTGRPFVGVFGTTDDRRVKALGLVHLPDPEAAEEPAAPPAAANPLADRPAVPASDGDANSDPNAAAAATPTPSGSGSWVLVAIGVLVLTSIALALWYFLGTRKDSPADRELRRRAAEGRPRRRPGPPSDEVLDVLPGDPLPTGIQATRPQPTPLVRTPEREPRPDFGLGPPRFISGKVQSSWGGHKVYRVYLFPDEVAVIDAGPADARKQYANAGYAFGGLLGWVIGRALAEGVQDRAEQRRRALDMADSELLLAVADEDAKCFRAHHEDLLARLEVPTFWKKLFVYGFGCHALLRLHCPARSEFLLEFHGPLEVDDAVKALTGYLPADTLDVRLAWDNYELKYVAKV